ncbi:MAG: 2-amino-4-hydroxy-6-hydroxymethyldihydropteridine diphosphokinase [Planctomycetota bacterium]|nr:2-amino-4-hydroxy-6-hydroxymethyldihydropteridine diphosphokinase [Planctomycetota bacterium]MDA1106079.1 2-amino-4-hydroxy-6-hydroxymethyldihydropteridine diphosphokinase [Planctomycetota bacterium]
MTQVALGLGSNLGDRLATMDAALSLIAQVPYTRIVSVSRVYETLPVGVVDQPLFLNAAALVESGSGVPGLMACAHAIERSLGRDRSSETRRWGPRTIDLDILMAGPGGSAVLESSDLIVPHPHAFLRAFVLFPLADIVPEWCHPRTGERVDLAAHRAADCHNDVVLFAQGLACTGTTRRAGLPGDVAVGRGARH